LFFKTTGKISRLKPKTLNRTLPLATFEATYQLLQQMAELPGAIWLTDDAMIADSQNRENSSERFAAVVSEHFSALLRGNLLDEFATNGHKHSEKNLHSQLNVQLTFDPGAIANFLSPLADKLAEITPAPSWQIDIRALKQAIKNIQPNSAVIQSEFTLNLLDILAANASPNNRSPLHSQTDIGKISAQSYRSRNATDPDCRSRQSITNCQSLHFILSASGRCFAAAARARATFESSDNSNPPEFGIACNFVKSSRASARVFGGRSPVNLSI